MSKSKVASIRALQELEGIVSERKSTKFSPLVSQAEKNCSTAKSDVSKRIQDELEEYAVEKYKEYGLVVIPICHRSTSYKESDVVRPELRVKVFDKTAEREYQKLIEESRVAQVKIEDWYFKAVQAVVEQIDLPPTPEF